MGAGGQRGDLDAPKLILHTQQVFRQFREASDMTNQQVQEATAFQLETLSQRIRQAQENAQVWVTQAKSNPQVQRIITSLDKLEQNVKLQAQQTVDNLQVQKSNIEDWQLLKKLNDNVRTAGVGISKSISSVDLSIPKLFQDDFDDYDLLPSSARAASRVKFSFTGGRGLDDSDESQPSFDDQVEDNFARQLVEQSKTALQQCQEQLRQSANNCQENIETLKAHLQKALTTEYGEDTQQQPTMFPIDLAMSLRQLLKGDTMNQQEVLEFIARDEFDGPVTGPFQLEAVRRRRHRQNRKRSTLDEDGRHIAIYTTAALPWMTGTSVNPLLRAAFLANDTSRKRKVTLVVPWVARQDQHTLFPKGVEFDTPEQQEQYIRGWVEKRTGFKSSFGIQFYPGRFAAEKQSILPVGDLTSWIPDHDADVAVLEEPEHLTWYHHGKRFNEKFNHVVGVMHTNYVDYARREVDGDKKAAILKFVNQWVTRAHCHKVIKLSDAVQDLPRQETMFIHGVSPQFLHVGEAINERLQAGEPFQFDKGAYFIGKVLWGKGYTELLDMVGQAKRTHGYHLPMDVYGYGDDFEAVVAQTQRDDLPLAFHGCKDHLDDSIHGYRVFVNPSTSDVVATTTAEALAMGKWVVCAEHACNKFFSQFDNCLIYRDAGEFAAKLDYAMSHDPTPLPAAQRQMLTWEDATRRFIQQASITEAHQPNPLDHLAFLSHNTLTSFEPLRVAIGAGVNTRDAPARVADYVPEQGCGGFMDDHSRLQKQPLVVTGDK